MYADGYVKKIGSDYTEEQTLLANERTMLSYIRTYLAFTGAGR